MQPRDRRVTTLPLSTLFDEDGPREARRERELDSDGVAGLLRLGALVVVACIGEPLRWMRGSEAFGRWKQEAKPRLWEPDREGVSLEDFPDERAWRASEWRTPASEPILVFEAYD